MNVSDINQVGAAAAEEEKKRKMMREAQRGARRLSIYLIENTYSTILRARGNE